VGAQQSKIISLKTRLAPRELSVAQQGVITATASKFLTSASLADSEQVLIGEVPARGVGFYRGARRLVATAPNSADRRFFCSRCRN